MNITVDCCVGLVYIHPILSGCYRRVRILIRPSDGAAIGWAGGYRLESMDDHSNECIVAL